MLLLTDADVQRCVAMRDAVQAMREALQSRADGLMVTSPRTGFKVGTTGLVWTPGGFEDTFTLGLRLYLTGDVHRGDQLVALWDAKTGALRCLALGAALGRLRTGAIGGAAMAAMAREDAAVLGVVGFGAQAWQQVEAALAVRPIRRVQAYRRDRDELVRLVDAGSEQWGLEVVAAPDARAAVEGADIVVTATNAAEPVIQADWVQPGTHVNALGPKYVGRQEIGLDLAERAAVLACDFPEQYRGEEDFFLQGTGQLERMRDLAELLASGVQRAPSDVTLFLSHGLAGTEVRLLQAAYAQAKLRGIGQEIAI
ncbi:MAG: hypothetical protein M0Z66_16200 [Thermaerobacter sp.]|nr:hypothetical protein [Thermaerobacter sp.]